ncbi:hypothetical protein CXG81DRAFT_20773 [Caulochytrium protostelioides]|uniref:Uncharacterized protein n=1 Tax=Caulochytrium protostelioides TaxID=1555241 RepID=A0A4P9X1T6_9FUNG|nr:hypothetical protein CXG81DRAFT_20773 [Caulochytrium protostelioides]|eukprot:RKO99115.1 hypothetical protein CXG81DRAFT_20773 [Caulochytrium protostelioides]
MRSLEGRPSGLVLLLLMTQACLSALAAPPIDHHLVEARASPSILASFPGTPTPTLAATTTTLASTANADIDHDHDHEGDDHALHHGPEGALGDGARMDTSAAPTPHLSLLADHSAHAIAGGGAVGEHDLLHRRQALRVSRDPAVIAAVKYLTTVPVRGGDNEGETEGVPVWTPAQGETFLAALKDPQLSQHLVETLVEASARLGEATDPRDRAMALVNPTIRDTHVEYVIHAVHRATVRHMQIVLEAKPGFMHQTADHLARADALVPLRRGSFPRASDADASGPSMGTGTDAATGVHWAKKNICRVVAEVMIRQTATTLQIKRSMLPSLYRLATMPPDTVDTTENVAVVAPGSSSSLADYRLKRRADSSLNYEWKPAEPHLHGHEIIGRFKEEVELFGASRDEQAISRVFDLLDVSPDPETARKWGEVVDDVLSKPGAMDAFKQLESKEARLSFMHLLPENQELSRSWITWLKTYQPVVDSIHPLENGKYFFDGLENWGKYAASFQNNALDALGHGVKVLETYSKFNLALYQAIEQSRPEELTRFTYSPIFDEVVSTFTFPNGEVEQGIRTYYGYRPEWATKDLRKVLGEIEKLRLIHENPRQAISINLKLGGTTYVYSTSDGPRAPGDDNWTRRVADVGDDIGLAQDKPAKEGVRGFLSNLFGAPDKEAEAAKADAATEAAKAAEAAEAAQAAEAAKAAEAAQAAEAAKAAQATGATEAAKAAEAAEAASGMAEIKTTCNKLTRMRNKTIGLIAGGIVVAVLLIAIVVLFATPSC